MGPLGLSQRQGVPAIGGGPAAQQDLRRNSGCDKP